MQRTILRTGLLTISFFFFFGFLSKASAHVVVSPPHVDIGAFQTFTIGVPNEKDIPTTNLRLVIPEGLKHVSPNVKPGWDIYIKKAGEGENERVTEISWSDGNIPPGQRDDFFFSAQVPTTKQTIIWKAYQTYQDGTVVSWDQNTTEKEDENESNEDETSGPSSQTKIVDDLTTNPSKEDTKELSSSITFSIAALVLAGLSLGLQFRKRSK